MFTANYTDSLEITANVEVKKGGIMPAIDLRLFQIQLVQLLDKG